MFRRIIKNDILASKLVSTITFLFIAAASALVSLAVLSGCSLSGAIDHFMEQAKTPHFMQMHAGTVDAARMEEFARENEKVEDFQIISFLNIEGADIVVEGKSLADSVTDNGLVTQSVGFDYLLDFDGEVIQVKEGEIYLPLCYMRDQTAQVGDKMTICGEPFVVGGFLRDSQMNASLAMSKRFLVSDAAYGRLESKGSEEYLIEFRLKNPDQVSAFEQDYTNAGLEANGPLISGSFFKLLNALSDGMMIAVILLVSGILVIISFLCIRFTLLARIDKDYREIGVMKAIRLRIADIKKIYLAKYAFLAAIGAGFGYLISFACKGIVLENIRLFMGEGEKTIWEPILSLFGVLLIFLAVIAYVRKTLKRFHRISSAQALRFAGDEGDMVKTGKLCLSRNHLAQTNLFLGIKAVLAQKKLYVTLLFTKSFSVEGVDGEKENIKVELGDHSLFPVNYEAGTYPVSEDEIALSSLNASELGKQLGDTVVLTIDGKDRELSICGIYADVTNGGKTAKAVFTSQEAVMWCVILAQATDEKYIEEIVDRYSNQFSYAKIASITEYIHQSMGSMIDALQIASILATVVALLITMLITALFMKMLTVKERYSIAVMKALGFRNGDITKQYVTRSLFILVIGLLAGTLLANTLGEIIAGMLISSLGASRIQFVIDPLQAYLLYPLLLALVVAVTTIISTAKSGRVSIADNIKE